MEAKDVMNLPWKKVTDWSELSASQRGRRDNCKYYVSSLDVNVFVENVFRDIARKLSIPYEGLKPILQSENVAFYTLENELFAYCSGYGRENTRLIELENTLRVPDVSNIENAVTKNNVSACVELFNGLSDIEKAVFLQKIGKINIKIERFANETEEITVD